MNKYASKPWMNPRIPFKTRMKMAWEEDKRQIREASWPKKIGLVTFRIVMLPFILALIIGMWAFVGIMYVITGVFILLAHWQTYALLAVILLTVTLIHFGII